MGCFYKIGVGVGTLIATASLAAMPLAALSTRECHAAYKAAQRSGTLGGLSWPQFRKARCGRGAAARAGDSARSLPKTGSAYLPGGRAVFPTAVAPKYVGEIPHKARRRTCLDQYRLNKASDSNGGLKWVEKDGGYYAECSRRLRSGWKP
jgi:hypothetical protein